MSIEKKCENCSLDGRCLYQSIETNCIDGHYIPKEELVREQCINDFECIINNINMVTNFDGIYEDIIFNNAIEEYKKKLIERLEKYLKEKNID